jgi:hypothetical protein
MDASGLHETRALHSRLAKEKTMKREKELELLGSSLEIARGKNPFMSQEETLIPMANY